MAGLSLYIVCYAAIALGPWVILVVGLLLRHPQLVLVLSASAAFSYLFPVLLTSIVFQIIGAPSTAVGDDSTDAAVLSWVWMLCHEAARVLFCMGLVRAELAFRRYGQTLSYLGGRNRWNFVAIGGAAGLGFGLMRALLRVGAIATTEAAIVLSVARGRDPVGASAGVPTVWWDTASCTSLPKGPYEATESLLRTSCEILWTIVVFYGIAVGTAAAPANAATGGGDHDHEDVEGGRTVGYQPNHNSLGSGSPSLPSSSGSTVVNGRTASRRPQEDDEELRPIVAPVADASHHDNDNNKTTVRPMHLDTTTSAEEELPSPSPSSNPAEGGEGQSTLRRRHVAPAAATTTAARSNPTNPPTASPCSSSSEGTLTLSMNTSTTHTTNATAAPAAQLPLNVESNNNNNHHRPTNRNSVAQQLQLQLQRQRAQMARNRERLGPIASSSTSALRSLLIVSLSWVAHAIFTAASMGHWDRNNNACTLVLSLHGATVVVSAIVVGVLMMLERKSSTAALLMNKS